MKVALQNQTKAPAASYTTPAHTGLLQRKCACGGSAGLNNDCEDCSNDRLKLQRSTRNSESETQNSPAVPGIVHDVLRSPGEPLDAETRAFMEPRFGHDFSQVRVHTDARAANAAAAVDARAFTMNRNIVFAAGEYAPRFESGLRLLSHELTHVLQQRVGVNLKNRVGQVGDAYERQADQVAVRVAEGKLDTLGKLPVDRSLSGVTQPVSLAPAVLQFQKTGPDKPGTKAGTGLDQTSNPATGAIERAKRRAEQGPDLPAAPAGPTFPQKIYFWLHGFIPNTVSGATKARGGPYSGRTVFPSPPHPFHQNSCFETDERGFDSSVTASSRVRVVGLLDTVARTLTSAALSDLTFEIDCTSGSLKCEKTPSPSVSVSLMPELLTPTDQFLIALSVTANDPCVTGSPDLALRGVIAIDRKTRTFNFTGATSLYPAFEMYASVGDGSMTVFKQGPIIDSPLALLSPGVSPRDDEIRF
jgi:hypothetical protein